MSNALRRLFTNRAARILWMAPLLFWSPLPVPTATAIGSPPRDSAAPPALQAPAALLEKLPVQVQAPAPPKEKKPDVIFVPTPQNVVEKMLDLAQIKKGDVLYDLGCGDGRIVVTAAKKYGVKAYGFDVDPQRIKEARENVANNGVGNLVTILHADIFEADLRPANVVTLYLLPELNVRLMPQLRQLKDGSRIVSHDFDMRGAKPRQVVTVRTDDQEEEHTIYLWTVPWEKEE
jgi:SAM-dependent methyltransferase